jgi:hypothetical protein
VSVARCAIRPEPWVTARLDHSVLNGRPMPMEPNRTRQVIQDLARAFNKLASELTADLSYAAREIDSLRKEVQRLRSSSATTSRTNGGSKKSSSHASKTKGTSRKTRTSHREGTLNSGASHESPKPAHEPGSFVFPQEPFNPSPPPEPSGPGNN